VEQIEPPSQLNRSHAKRLKQRKMLAAKPYSTSKNQKLPLNHFLDHPKMEFFPIYGMTQSGGQATTRLLPSRLSKVAVSSFC